MAQQEQQETGIKRSSPWQSNQTPDDFAPAAKRPRLSPGPVSPFTQSPQTPFANSQNYSNIALPNGAFNNQRPTNGLAPLPQATGQQPTPGTMGPPQRPAERVDQKPVERGEKEKPLDINEINDLVTSSGINLREEEDYLYASYRSDRNNTSFKSESSQTISPQTSFDLLSQTNFGSLGSSHGTLQQQPSKQSQEEELYERHKKAARAVNESVQNHLENPFLWAASVRRIMEKQASENGIKIPIDGLWDRIVNDRPRSMSGTSMANADGAAIVEARAPSMLSRGSLLEPMLSLISFATNERIRGLLEDAYGLARGRQFGSDGVVPPEFSDLVADQVTEQATVVPSSASATAWDHTQAASKTLPSPPDSSGSPGAKPKETVSTIAIPKVNSLTKALTLLSQNERAAEEARLKARAARRAKKASQAAQAAASAAATPESGTPAPPSTTDGKLPTGMLGERAPEAKLSKKEREKAAKQDISEEVATRNANTTASMQLGGRSYSWMQTGKKPAAPPPRPSVGAGVSKSTGTSGGSAASQDKNGLGTVRDRKFGEWREDGIGGRGVQIRDWVGVLETDGREPKTLTRAYARLGSAQIDEQEPKQEYGTQ